MKWNVLKSLVLAMSVWSIASIASAQYAWIDEKGVKQYSDMPPPASVPDSRILKLRGRPMPAAQSNEASIPKDSAEDDKKVPMTTAEKNAEFEKRRAERAEKDKKAQEEAKMAAENAKNCERAREYHRTLSSGERIARRDKNGERSFLTDEQRAQEMKEAQRLLDKCKA